MAYNERAYRYQKWYTGEFYNELGLQASATAPQIKSAYRRLTREFHPDVNAHLTEAEKAQVEERFQKVAYAYEVLGDFARKSYYDTYGKDELHDYTEHVNRQKAEGANGASEGQRQTDQEAWQREYQQQQQERAERMRRAREDAERRRTEAERLRAEEVLREARERAEQARQQAEQEARQRGEREGQPGSEQADSQDWWEENGPDGQPRWTKFGESFKAWRRSRQADQEGRQAPDGTQEPNQEEYTPKPPEDIKEALNANRARERATRNESRRKIDAALKEHRRREREARKGGTTEGSTRTQEGQTNGGENQG